MTNASLWSSWMKTRHDSYIWVPDIQKYWLIQSFLDLINNPSVYNTVGQDSQQENACSQHTLVKPTLTPWKCVDFLKIMESLGCLLLSWLGHVGCEDWKLAGTSISLDCFHLQTFYLLRTFYKVTRQLYTSGIYNTSYKPWVLWSWLHRLS